jgi:hypothetical protein
MLSEQNGAIIIQISIFHRFMYINYRTAIRTAIVLLPMAFFVPDYWKLITIA